MNYFSIKGFIILVTIIFPCLLRGQNLVPNPSFEEGPDQCGFTRLPELFNIPHWTLPTPGTTDIFSTQISNQICWAYAPRSTTTNSFSPAIGHQYPRSGNRFVGMISMALSRPEIRYREYLQAKLTEPLAIGETYCAEMYVSLAEQPKYASNNLGLLFTNEKILQQDAGYFISREPQVFDSRVITDSVTWTRIAGLFTADSTYQYVTVGAFFEYDETRVLDKGGIVPGSWSYETAYYYVDDVSVAKAEAQKFSFEGDTVICLGSTTTIEALVKWDSVHWTTLLKPSDKLSESSRLVTSPRSTTTYLVRGKVCNTWISDTVTIYVRPGPELSLGADTVLCIGETLTLNAQDGFKNYQWSDGSIAQSLDVSKSGLYNVTGAYDDGCEVFDEVNVLFVNSPVVDLGRDTVTCEFFPLDAKGKNAGNLEYEWSAGTTDSTFLPTEKGTYWVKVKNQCGQATDTITIDAFDNLVVANVVTPNDDGLNDKLKFSGIANQFSAALSIYNSWGLQIYSNDHYSGEWPIGDVEPGVYYFSVEHNNCPNKKGWVHVLK
jgi:hypothetical protein